MYAKDTTASQVVVVTRGQDKREPGDKSMAEVGSSGEVGKILAGIQQV